MRSDIKSKLNKFFYDHFEFDRKAERAVKKSIHRYHSGGGINHIIAKLEWNRIRKKYGCDIYPGITVGDGLRIEHPMWVCIGKTAVLGNNVRVYNNVMVVAKVTGDEERLKNGERRHARIGNGVIIGSGATIIGPVEIGDNCIIGARAIVTHNIPPNSVVIGTNNIRQRRQDEDAPAYNK